MVDHVHPTAFGQIAIAERALAVLAADGLPARVSPASLFSYRTTRWRRLRGDLTYVYRDLKQRTRAAGAASALAGGAGWSVASAAGAASDAPRRRVAPPAPD